ncbi:MAG: M1 family aminopeptidase, partial [Cytophagales bacterium]
MRNTFIKSVGIYLLITSIFSSCTALKPKKGRDNSTKTGEKPAWVSQNYGYKPARNIDIDLLHTKLEVNFDWKDKQMAGKAYLTLKPYLYPQDSVVLDAKGFEIKSVQLIDKKSVRLDLIYEYDTRKLKIKLDRKYEDKDTFLLFIEYVAKPEQLKTAGGEAITSDKGLFFITPDSARPDKPYQIWTQGETESSSCWFPTFDSPNQKCTQEMFITVDEKYKTLSNGEFIYSHKNADGSRTDYWRQNLPHSVYLFMMAVGDFAIVTDKWNKIPVNYYVEPKYEKYAKSIFGLTPEMMTFFSSKLNYNYPWAKYSSIVVRDYVSGAMENTSATIFMDALQKTSRELLDENYENIIAHELFHHWFGDLVTAESWAHLPLNESFATYAECMWEEYKRGKMAADYARLNDLESYLREAETKREPLIRYGYKNPDDLFDSHSYAKGGCILSMLRNVVGDAAFYQSLALFLKKNEYKNAEIHDLRHAFEEITGQDLNWFFDQWFMKAGHPELTIMDTYQDGKLKLIVIQTQDTLYAPIYKLPFTLEIYTDSGKILKELLITKAKHIFEFPIDQKPNLVLFDPNRMLVAKVKHSKSMNEFLVQYQKSDAYYSKYEALDELGTYKDTLKVRESFMKALDEPFWKLREIAVENLNEYKGKDSTLVLLRLSLIAQNDENTSIKANAIQAISRKNRPKFDPIYKKGLKDSSYAVVGASLLAYLKSKPADIDSTLKIFDIETNNEIVQALSGYYASNYDSTKLQWFENKIKAIKPESLFFLIQDFGTYLVKSPKKMQEKGTTIL